MNKEIKNYLSEFKTNFDGEPWYGKALMAVLRDASPKKVFTKPSESGHSAWEIAHHLHAWKDLLVKRLNGATGESIKMNSKEDWASMPEKPAEAEWKLLIEKLEINQRELIKALGKWKDADLDKNFAGTGYPLRTHLNGQIQHDIYHTGQIALALKNVP